MCGTTGSSIMTIYLLIAVGINILMFLPAFIIKTDKFTDISYALTFIVLTWTAWIVNPVSAQSTLIAAMLTAWALRLGIFLRVRIGKMEKDKRFDGIRGSFPKFLGFWIFQGISVWIVMIPALWFISKNSDEVCFAGVLIWAAGLLVETIADTQKFRFHLKTENKGKFIRTGLWSTSRHPNYFGEILCWAGVYLYVLPALSGTEVLWTLAGPIYIVIILLFVSGIPTVEKRADEKYGADPDYRDYKERTSMLIPWKKKAAKQAGT